MVGLRVGEKYRLAAVEWLFQVGDCGVLEVVGW
jgi:hypothetical protein